jgi:hypothetical protein
MAQSLQVLRSFGKIFEFAISTRMTHGFFWSVLVTILGVLLVLRDGRKQLLASEHTLMDIYHSHAEVLFQYHTSPARCV